jgi:uncharacterized protein YjiS (DUF1127 family)
MTEITFAKTWPTQTRAWPENATSFAGAVAGALWRTLLTWQRRARERDRLAAMSDYMLKDMGITRAEAAREYRKPFWSA